MYCTVDKSHSSGAASTQSKTMKEVCSVGRLLSSPETNARRVVQNVDRGPPQEGTFENKKVGPPSKKLTNKQISAEKDPLCDHKQTLATGAKCLLPWFNACSTQPIPHINVTII